MKVIIDPHTHLVVELRNGEVLYEHLPEVAMDYPVGITPTMKEILATLNKNEKIVPLSQLEKLSNK